jgi:hypothetical protein
MKKSESTSITSTSAPNQTDPPDESSGEKTVDNASRKKRLAYGVILLLLTLAFIEFSSFMVYFIVTKQPVSLADLSTARSHIIENVPTEDGFEVGGLKVPWDVPIHPYYGFGRPEGFDFLQQPDERVQNDPNGVIVAITGGSVAFGLYNQQKEFLQRYLEDIPEFEGKNIHVVLLGYFAWKQPQQATALMYYLTMGGKVDIVINLDGHNEIVDTNTNYRKKVYPAYPWLWYSLASNAVSAAELRLIGEVRYWKGLRYSLATFAEKTAFGISSNVVWYFLDRLFESGIEQREVRLSELQSSSKSSRPFRRFGPDRQFESLQSRREFSTQIWLSSSIQLDRITKANGGEYFHFLQPNQYVPRSKSFTREERRKAYDPRRANAVKVGYSYLITASPQLQNEQVKFYDLTNIYKDITETVYRDACCHVNKFGNELMAQKIGSVIVQHYAKKKQTLVLTED